MSLLDELFPLPSHSPLGPQDSLARAVRRALAVAILVFFLIVTVYLLLSPAPETKGHARQLTGVFFTRDVEIRADR